MKSDDIAGVIAPPPLILAAFLVAGIGLGMVTGWAVPLPGAIRFGLGAVLLGGSVIVAASAVILFRRAGTSPEPWHPTTAIVEAGPYRLTRNPMYLAMTIFYLGATILAESLPALALLPALVLVLHFGVIRREEAYLERKFGAPYRAYKARVRRWI